MPTTISVKGQVTIPKKVRDALRLSPGDSVEFEISALGQVVVQKAVARSGAHRNRFEAVRGKAQIKWKTDDLMALLRGND